MKNNGFTLLELLVVIGVIGILAAVVLVAVNPSRQFASARDVQRRSGLYSLTNAIYQYAAENNGDIPDGITTSTQTLGTSFLNLADDLVPTYLPEMPIDPSSGSQEDSGYQIYEDADGRIVATADSELNPGETIEIRR